MFWYNKAHAKGKIIFSAWFLDRSTTLLGFPDITQKYIVFNYRFDSGLFWFAYTLKNA